MNTFLIEISLFFLSLQGAFSCSLGPGYVPSTLAEQVSAAPIVAQGIAVTQNGELNPFVSSITLEVGTYYTGCAPASIVVSGFSSSSLCGIDPPVDGEEIIVFIKVNPNDTSEYVLNEINVYTGMVIANDNVESAVMQMTDGGLSPEECVNQPPETEGPTERNEACPTAELMTGDVCDAAEEVVCRYRTMCCDGKRARKNCLCRGGLWRCEDGCMTNCRCCVGQGGSCSDGNSQECCVDGSFSCPTETGESTCPDANSLVPAGDTDGGAVYCYPDPQCNTENFCMLTRMECCSRFEDGSTSMNGVNCLPCLEKKSS